MIAFAWFMLCIWPIVAIVLFRRFDLPKALCVNFMAAYLILPSALGIDLPILPELNKYTIPVLIALFMSAIILASPESKTYALPGWIPRNPVIFVPLGMLLLGNLGTVLTNMDPLFYGPRVIPGARFYDTFAMTLNMLMMVLPYLLARRILATPDAQRTLLVVLAVSMLIYTLPALWEVRLSPQLHRQVYGFFPGNFVQQIRAGGFRPHVFINHGLALASMMCLAILAAAALFRTSRPKTRMKWALAAGWMLFVLVLCKSLGALAITLLVLPLVLFLAPRTQLMAAAGIATVVLVYPMLRSIDVVPVDRVLSMAERIDPARAASLEFRLNNEDLLLSKARERPLFGWGGWSRNRYFDETGRDLSVTDGAWVAEMGVGGWVRYIGVFGLLCWPIIGLFLSKRDKIDPVCAILALIMAAKLIDLLPNTGLVPLVWVIAGSLAGRLEMRAGEVSAASGHKVDVTPGPLGYRRPEPGLQPATTGPSATAAAPDAPTYTRATAHRHVRRK